MPKQMSRHSSVLKSPRRQAGNPRPHPGEPSHGPLTAEELQLAVRNHSMPLEALRSDTTPPGLHYVLTHFDIPFIDAEHWHLRIGGAVQRSLELSLRALLRAPSITLPVTLECAGNGRSLLRPRPLSQPWVLEGVGTAVWTGVPLAYLLTRAGVEDDAVEVLFTGADAGSPGRRRPAVRPEPADRGGPAARRRARLPDERRGPAAAARLSAPAGGARLVRHGEREVADLDQGSDQAL